MTAAPATTKDNILLCAYRLFYREGFTRVSVDAIAAEAQVTKRTVYYHFPSKDDIVADVLKNQHAHVLQRFQRWADGAAASPEALVESLFHQLKEWADGEGWMGSGFTRISTELADRPGHPARKAASSHKQMTEAWLADQLGERGVAEPGNVGRQIMVLIEGSMSLALIHGDTGYIAAAGSAALALVKD